MDIENIVMETREIAARTEAKVDFLVSGFADHETRIRSTEKWRWGIPGGFVAAVLAGFAAMFGLPVSL